MVSSDKVASSGVFWSMGHVPEMEVKDLSIAEI
jgi:hypothetical protein